jgi:hypothetical protein
MKRLHHSPYGTELKNETVKSFLLLSFLNNVTNVCPSQVTNICHFPYLTKILSIDTQNIRSVLSTHNILLVIPITDIQNLNFLYDPYKFSVGKRY